MDANKKHNCPVCNKNYLLLEAVDFNKSCEESNGKYLDYSGIFIYYALCNSCGFCFSPEISAWQLQEFESKIYNNEYVTIDPDYVEARPRANAENLMSMFPHFPTAIKHLDYGGGDGLLANLLRHSGWNSTSYDPFVNRNMDVKSLGEFDLITAFEVFEHVPDIHVLMSNLQALLAPNGVIIFSTLLSDNQIHQNQKLTWWYASPRNGHISLFSKKSLQIITKQYGFNFGSFSDAFHILWVTVPQWASHLIR
jgi:SAM-dependent methyltransferase